MKTASRLFLFGMGLVLATARSASAQGENSYLHFQAATRVANAGISPAGTTGATRFSGSSAGGAGLMAANCQTGDDTTTATFNVSKASLAGACVLLLLQRRHRPQMISRP